MLTQLPGLDAAGRVLRGPAQTSFDYFGGSIFEEM